MQTPEAIFTMATGFIQHTLGHLCKPIPLELTSNHYCSTTCSGRMTNLLHLMRQPRMITVTLFVMGTYKWVRTLVSKALSKRGKRGPWQKVEELQTQQH